MFTRFSQSQMCDVPTKLNICSSFFSGSGYLFENWLVVLLQLLELFVQVFQPLLPAKRNEWMMKTTAILDQRQTVQRINQLIPLAKYQVIRPTTNQTSKWRERIETCLWHWHCLWHWTKRDLFVTLTMAAANSSGFKAFCSFTNWLWTAKWCYNAEFYVGKKIST